MARSASCRAPAFYTRFGFEVLEPGEFTGIGSVLLGMPINYGAGPGEQFFFRWRG